VELGSYNVRVFYSHCRQIAILSFWSQFGGFNLLDFHFIVLVWWFSYSRFQFLMSTVHRFDSHDLNLMLLLDSPNPHIFYSWYRKFTILILLIPIWWSWSMVSTFLILISWSWSMVLINGFDPLDLELIFLVNGFDVHVFHFWCWKFTVFILFFLIQRSWLIVQSY